MRIVEAISDTNVGGAGVLLENRLRYTDSDKYEIFVALPKGSMLAERLNKMGIKFYEIDAEGDRSFQISAIFKYLRALKKINPDLINCHGNLSARIAAKLCGVPVKICTRHCVFPVGKLYRYKIFKFTVGFFNSFLSDRFIAVAYAARDNLLRLGISKKKINVIINGSQALPVLNADDKITVKRRLGIDEDAFVIAFCARLEKCKGHSWFFLSLKELLRQQRKCVAVLIGDGSIKNELIRLCDDLGIEQNVIFTGFVSDVSQYMNIADVNVNCSVGTETSSLALSEGMSLGLPSVVSDYGGNPYMVEHGINGFVCKCYDWKAMAKYIAALMDDTGLYRSMSLEARKRFTNELNSERMAKKTNLLYEELLEAYHRAKG